MINFTAESRRDRRKVVRRAFVFCAFALTATAGVAAELRGFISEGAAGVLQFQFCKGAELSRELFPVEDKTPNGALRQGVGAVRQIMLRRYQPLYVEARGERGKTNATVYQFQRALGTVEPCKTLPRDIASNVRFHAIGQAPGWRLVITDAAAMLELPDKVPMKLPAVAFKSAGTDQAAKEAVPQAYDVQSGDGTPIRVEVNPQMCTDGRSETAYGARVTLRVEKRVLQGCAARF